MAEELEGLIAKLEQAAEVSRELDCLVAPVAGWHRVKPRHTSNRKGAWISPDDWIGTHSDGRPILDGLHGTETHRNPPRYTTSLDAALTLVPEGWFVRSMGEHRTLVTYKGDTHEPINWFAEVQWIDGGGRLIHHNAHSLPLALCIAALRARLP